MNDLAATVSITLDDEHADPVHEVVLSGLKAYNREHAPHPDSQRLILSARDGTDAVLAGLVGVTAWRWLHVELLWVAASSRRQGIGRRLLRYAEQEAIRRGCLHAYLDTFDFQARPFEETPLRNGIFDAAIGNVPFGKISLDDPEYKHLKNFSIHDFFFATTLEKVRPGGIVAFITSRYTMDKASESVRRYIGERADLLGAIRLPYTAFEGNAGTDVVTDILFLRVREKGCAGRRRNLDEPRTGRRR